MLLHPPHTFPCSSVGPLLGQQSFRINLLQHLSTKRKQFPSVPTPVWASMDISASTGVSVDICSTMTFSMGLQGHAADHHDLHQGCRAISSSAPGEPTLLLFLSPLLAAELFVSLVFLIPHTAVWHFALSYTLFPRSATTLAVGSALPCGGLVGVVWSCRGLAQGNSGSSSHGPSTLPLKPLHQHTKHCIKVQCCFSDCGKSEFSDLPCGVVSI